jgi:penicillin-binding protein 1A
MRIKTNLLLRIVLGLFIFCGFVFFAGGLYFLKLLSDLPDISSIDNYQPSLTTILYTADDEPFAQFAVEKRILVSISDIPQDLINAVVAVEDARFFQHNGLDWQGISRAFWKNLKNMRFSQGASTITQQLSRSLFLTQEKKISRKIKEAVIARRIEKKYSKKDILELYLNQVYFGSGAYGVESAARTYFGKSVKELNLEECAMLAGLPQAPSRYSPKRNSKLAKSRRAAVFQRMLDEHFIDQKTFDSLKDRDVELAEKKMYKTKAPYFSECVRRILEKKYGSQGLYHDGFHVYTTLDLPLQLEAVKALRWGLKKFDKRHGYRPLQDISDKEHSAGGKSGYTDPLTWSETNLPVVGDIVLGKVAEIREQDVIVHAGNYQGILPPKGYAWTKTDIPEEIFQQGNPILVRVVKVEEDNIWFSLEQEPVVQGSLVSLEAQTGSVKALVGGYDFGKSKFIRAVQALRQPGSAFKPIIYLCALSRGHTLADVLMDSPLIYHDKTREADWRPENYNKKFFGPTTLRSALAHSRNVVTIKLLKKIGIDNVIEKARIMGLDAEFAKDLSLALGTSGISLLDMTAAYGVFANGGFRVKPVLIRKITNSQGEIIEENQPESIRAISEQEAYLMNRLLMGVVEGGTGWRARALGRDVAGKTGTTDQYVDAWFIGYSPEIVSGVWVGYDEHKTLGKMETGSKAASPIWVKYMQKALRRVPLTTFSKPDKIVSVTIDADTGLLAGKNCKKILTENFIRGTAPRKVCDRHRSAAEKFQIVDMEMQKLPQSPQTKKSFHFSDIASLD